MRISSITKNAGKACNNRLYRHIRTFEKIVKNYFVIFDINPIESICNFFNQLKNHHKNIDVIEPPYGLQPFLGVQREPSENIVIIPDNGFFNGENYVADNRISG